MSPNVYKKEFSEKYALGIKSISCLIGIFNFIN
jgi:hypothetical protein